MTLETKSKAVSIPVSAPGTMTFEEFLAWGDGTHTEWVNGEVTYLYPAILDLHSGEVLMTVSEQHMDMSGFWLALLQFFAEARNPGEVFYAPFVMKLDKVRVGRAPDVMFVVEENCDRIRKNYLDGPADLVIEIVSPESVKLDTVEKLAEYEQGGVREYWWIDPESQRAAFHQRDESGAFRLVAPDERGIYSSAVLPGLWIEVNWLWQRPLPTLVSVLQAWGLI